MWWFLSPRLNDGRGRQVAGMQREKVNSYRVVLRNWNPTQQSNLRPLQPSKARLDRFGSSHAGNLTLTSSRYLPHLYNLVTLAQETTDFLITNWSGTVYILCDIKGNWILFSAVLFSISVGTTGKIGRVCRKYSLRNFHACHSKISSDRRGGGNWRELKTQYVCFYNFRILNNDAESDVKDGRRCSWVGPCIRF